MGQAKRKQRDCPAVGRVITPAECGENRVSRHACPAECPHNPWAPANYEQSLAIEDVAQNELFRRLREELGGPLPAAELDRIHRLSDLGRQQHFIKVFQHARDAQGRSFVERWAAAGFAGLNNDERNFVRWKTQARVRLLEIHEVRADGMCVAVDLLDPAAGPLSLLDRALHARACRFTQLLAWTFATPHYTRLIGIALHPPEVSARDALAVTQLVVEHLGGPTEGAEMRAWLETNLPRVEESFAAVSAALSRQMLAGVDARFTKTTYRLTGTAAELLRRLDDCAAVNEDDVTAAEQAEGFVAGRVWFDEAAPLEAGQGALPLASASALVAGRPALGRVLVAASQARLEAMTGARAAALRAQFEKRAGRLAEFAAERVDDLGAQMRLRQPAADDRLVPPRLVAVAPRLTLLSSRLDATAGALTEMDVMRRHDELFLGERVPALNNLTPRAAAADPAWRPELVRLVKQRIRAADERALRTGQGYDAGWLARELGLTELAFAAPPRRAPTEAPPADDADDLDDEWDADTVWQLDDSLPESPPLPAEPLTIAEVDKRMRAVMDQFPDVDSVFDEVDQVAPFIFEMIGGVLPENCSDAESDLAELLAAQAWLLLAPPGTRGWLPDENRFLSRFQESFDNLPEELAPADLERVLDTCRQPALAKLLGALILGTIEQGPRKRRTDPAVGFDLIMALVALVDALDEAARA